MTWIAISLIAGAFQTSADVAWTSREEISRSTELGVAYRAALDGDILLIEATHGETWHTYAMDNPARAKKAGGNLDLGLELPTEILVTGGLEAVGPWYQSKPKDLSDRDIGWYTFGFESVSYFATRVKRVSGDKATTTISAQACSEDSCRMVDRLELVLGLSDGSLEPSGVDLSKLVKVPPAPAKTPASEH